MRYAWRTSEHRPLLTFELAILACGFGQKWASMVEGTRMVVPAHLRTSFTVGLSINVPPFLINDLTVPCIAASTVSVVRGSTDFLSLIHLCG
ncbi:hypothetical protein EDD85DRAFT_869352 [Armillaria nabsnona]|nr:hypothetical protein EDD85DRAFT_869352 [Armillaria nabsnona]